MLRCEVHVLSIRTPQLQTLYLDWDHRRNGRQFPARRDFDVLDLKYIIGNLSLLDVSYEPLRFRFRLHASGVSERVGYEMTGHDLDELPQPDTREVMRRHYVDVVERRMPIVQMREREILDNRLVHCEVLALPLARDGKTIDMLMSGVIWL